MLIIFIFSYGHLIERVAIEFNQLLFNLNQSKGLPFVQKVQPVSIALLQLWKSLTDTCELKIMCFLLHIQAN